MSTEQIKKQNVELYNIVHNEPSDLRKAKDYILHLLEKNKFSFRKPVAVLDAGCGGRLAGLYYYQQLNIEKFIVCDINPQFVEKTMSGAKELGIHCAGLECSIEKLPLADVSADFVHCDGVLMHVPDYKSALNEFQRILKPGGYLLLGCYGYGGLLKYLAYPAAKIIRKSVSMHGLAGFMKRLGVPRGQDYSLLDLIYAPIQTLFTKRQMKRLLLKRNFHKINIYKSFKKIFNIPVLSPILFGNGYMYIIAQKK